MKKTFFFFTILMLSFFGLWAQNFSYEYQGPQTTAQYMEGYDLSVTDLAYTATITANDQSTGTFYINHLTTDLTGQLQNLFKYKGVDNNLSLLPLHTISLANGNQLISGTCYPDFDPALSKPFVMSIANDGTVNWAKMIDNLDTEAPFLKVLSDGSVLCIFKYDINNGLGGVFKAFCKIDANGNFSNFKEYPLGYDHPKKIIANSDGTFDMVTAQGHLVNVENDLSAINWTRKYFTDGGIKFAQTQNGDYIIATVQVIFGHSTIFRTNANGTVLWAKEVQTFEGVANNAFWSTHFNFIEEDSQGNIVVAVYEVNSFRTMHIVLDANGNFLSNFSTNNKHNTFVSLENDKLLYFNLDDFPGFDFRIEKRDLGIATACDNTNVSHNVINGNAMELTPSTLSLTTIADFATLDINIAVSNEPENINQVVFCSLGIAENDFSSDIAVYPNPTTGNLHIETSQKIDQIKVYNLMGQLIMKSDLTSFDMSGAPAGHYILEIFIGNRPHYKKIIKK